VNARLESRLRLLAVIIAAGTFAALAVNILQGNTSRSSMVVGIGYGLLISAAIGSAELFVLNGPMRAWLSALSFTVNLAVRSAIYAAIFAAIITVIQFLQSEVVVEPTSLGSSRTDFWSVFIYSAVISVLLNLLFGIANIIGPRAFLNFITGRYHSPVEESRFVLFVDIAGSTGLAERLGGVGIHRFLDRTFRLLTVAVVDYRGEVLDYVGDEVIVTWPEQGGAVDCRPLRCFLAMRDELAQAASQFEREFGVAPQIRGSLHFGPVIVGEIGDVKRAIVFNGDVMNTAARLEELSRSVAGGFLASRAAMQRFSSVPPLAMRDLGHLSIRGRADPIDVVGIDAPAPA
jgi:adenylate cyclase